MSLIIGRRVTGKLTGKTEVETLSLYLRLFCPFKTAIMGSEAETLMWFTTSTQTANQRPLRCLEYFYETLEFLHSSFIFPKMAC